MATRQLASSSPPVWSSTTPEVLSAVTGGHVESEAAGCEVISVYPEVDIYLAWGAAPQATPSHVRVAGSSGQGFDLVMENPAFKISVLAVADDGPVKILRSLNV